MGYEDIMAMILNKNDDLKPQQPLQEAKSEIFGFNEDGEHSINDNNSLKDLEMDYYR